MSETLSERILLQTQILTVGEFRCRAGDPLWSRENVARGNLVVFPRVPVLIAQADREAVVADANRVMFYEAGRAYTRARISGAGDACEFFGVDRALAEDAMSAAGASGKAAGLFPFAHGPSRARAYAAQRLIYEHASRCPRPDVLAVEATFVDVLLTVVGDALAARAQRARPRRESTRRTHAEIAEIARSVLAADPASPISLSQLAARVEVSPCHLCRVFRAWTGMTLSRYRDRLRLRASLERVPEPGADLTAIAHEHGFCSHSHFTSAFRREFGMTPTAFRTHVGATRRRDLVNLMKAA